MTAFFRYIAAGLMLMLALGACSGQPSYVPCPTGVITISDPQADCPAGMPE